MLLRRKVYIVIISLLGFLSQSLAYAYMDGAMAFPMKKHFMSSASDLSLENSANIDTHVITSTSMSDHCKDMAEVSTDTHGTSEPSDDADECCMQTCLCASGVCSSSLMMTVLPSVSLVPSHLGQFFDSNTQIVRVAVSLYRPPITA